MASNPEIPYEENPWQLRLEFSLPILERLPEDSSLSAEDRRRISNIHAQKITNECLIWEDLTNRYADSVSAPYFETQLARTFLKLGAVGLGLIHYLKAQNLLSERGLEDKLFNDWIVNATQAFEQDSKAVLQHSFCRHFRQTWKPTKHHKFPCDSVTLPAGHGDVKDLWSAFMSIGDKFFGQYLHKLAVDTNHVEGTFLITEASTRDLIHRGLADSVISALPDSEVQDPVKIKRILDDTMAAYDVLHVLREHPDRFDRKVVCDTHKRLMHTCRFEKSSVIGAGVTRGSTMTTVYIGGRNTAIQCCPYTAVDDELDYICHAVREVLMDTSCRNPFATASWIHLVLARCHPFDDGNGRISRLFGSIPLLRAGYPPISVDLSQQNDYYAGINKSYEGDHSAMMKCILEGMYTTLRTITALSEEVGHVGKE